MLSETHLRAEERARATHARFNVFTTLLQEDDEVKLHTRFLHCLLDPDGLHDCGPTFLDLFFITLGRHPELSGETPFCPSAAEGWVARKEAGRSAGYGQIDLLLEHPRFRIAIENKIHAREQPGQLASYASYLRSRPGTEFRLIYLTLHGSESKTHGNEPYVRISYAEHILAWLEECLRATYDLIPVNQLLLQYREVVRKLTGKTLEAAMMKPIARFVTENPDIVRYRAEWSSAVDEAKLAYMDRLANGIREALKGEFEVGLPVGAARFDFGYGIVIRTADGRPLLAEPFKVYLENDAEGELLAIGVFTDYDDHELLPGQKQWAERMSEALVRHLKGRDVQRHDSSVAWPIGWVNLLVELNDAGFATLFGRSFDTVLHEVCATIREYLQALLQAAAEVPVE